MEGPAFGARGRRRKRELSPGEVVAGKYRVDRVMGAGGMGTVFAATDVHLHRRVAIKVLSRALADDERAVRRFLREARSAVGLKSEHVVRVLEVGELASGAPYIAMEYLDGRDLDSLLESRGRIPFREAVDLLLQAIEGIAEAHAGGVVHRDLKPANLFLTRRSDGRPLVKVLDFGLAKNEPMSELGESALTSPSMVMGTHHYMSPEQLRGAKFVDSRTDIWALGVCLYQLITGRLPFQPLGRQNDIQAVTNGIVNDAPVPPHEIVGDLPVGLSLVVLHCLEKSPADRFADVAALAMALEPYASSELAGVGARIERVLEEVTHVASLGAMNLGNDTVVMEEPATERMPRLVRGKARRWLSLPRAMRAARSWVVRHVADATTTLLAVRPSTFDSILERTRARRVRGLLVGVLLVAIAVPVLAILGARVRSNEDLDVRERKTERSPEPALSASTESPTERTPEPARSLANVGVGPARTPPPMVTATQSPTPAADSKASPEIVSEPAKSGSDVAAATSEPGAAQLTPPPGADTPGTESSSTAPSVPPSPYESSPRAPSAARCTPPYTIDATGKKRWKLDCL